MRRTILIVLILVIAGRRLKAQEPARGIAMPVMVTGGLLVTERARAGDPDASRLQPGFHAIFYPSVKLNSGWFAYSAVQLESEPSHYYESFYPERELDLQIHQLFLGYNRTGEQTTIGFKVGKMPSAFGSFPLRYRDTSNPLLDEPLGYAYAVKLRPDQRPCGVRDLEHQQTYAVYVHHYCGGSSEERNGMMPVTLYGVTGAEIDVSHRRVDARFQLTNSSPANPQSLSSKSQHVQWTAGAGYTIRQGFRVGISGFRGAFLEKSVRRVLNPGTNERDYPAVGIGTDVSWGRGRWSVNGEWQKVQFNYPGFQVPPAVSAAYLELKTTLTPRFYTAFRGNYESYSRVKDGSGIVSNHFLPERRSFEIAVGYHFNRSQTLKVGYEWFKTNGVPVGRDNVFGMQFLTSIYSLSKPF